jgi:hypothetical protein
MALGPATDLVRPRRTRATAPAQRRPRSPASGKDSAGHRRVRTDQFCASCILGWGITRYAAEERILRVRRLSYLCKLWSGTLHRTPRASLYIRTGLTSHCRKGQRPTGRIRIKKKEHHHSQANRAVLMWATAAVLAMLACASLGIFLLRSIQTPSAVNGSTVSASVRSSSAAPSAPSPAKNPNRLLDLLVTGLVVGAGTKPLHDLISQIQTTSGKSKASASATTTG